MECNKDEALKAREVAENKFATKDIVGAKKFAIRAQNLYPKLDGIEQMIATFNVHLSAQSTINGEKDWYAILSVKNSVEDEILKKQYRKLALMLHPDKNKSIGAESAFMLISEAWGVLSDKMKRLVYDSKRSTDSGKKKINQFYGSCGFYQFVTNAARSSRNNKSFTRRNIFPSAKIASSATTSKLNMFWTLCNHCKMHYEYFRIFVDKSLVCPNCQKLFVAYESTNPTRGSKSHAHCTKSSYLKRSACHASGFSYDTFDSSNFHWGAFSRTTGAASAAASSSAAACAARMVHQIYEQVKRKREERQAVANCSKSVMGESHSTSKNYNNTCMGSLHGSFYKNVSDWKHTVLSDEPAKKRGNFSNDLIYSIQRDGNTKINTHASSSLHFDSSNVRDNIGIIGDFSLCRATLEQEVCFNREPCQKGTQTLLFHRATSSIQKDLDEHSFVEASKQQPGKEKQACLKRE